MMEMGCVAWTAIHARLPHSFVLLHTNCTCTCEWIQCPPTQITVSADLAVDTDSVKKWKLA